MTATLLRVVWLPGSDLLRGTCHCGATRVAEGPIEVWEWLLAHPTHEPPEPTPSSRPDRVPEPTPAPDTDHASGPDREPGTGEALPGPGAGGAAR